MRRLLLTALAGAAALLVAGSPAYAASYLDETVQALQNGGSYFSVQVRTIDTTTKELLAQQASATDVAVVVLPAEAAEETGGDTAKFVAEVAQRTGHDTVVVAFGNDLEAGSRDLPKGKASELANKTEGENTTTGEALLDFIAEVQTARSAPEPESDSDGFPIMAVALFVLFMAVAFVVIMRFLGRLPGWASPRVRSEPKAPETIEELLAEIQQLAAGVRNSRVREILSQAQYDTRQLFARLSAAGSTQIQETTAKYRNRLTNVRNLLRTYADIEQHPQYYPQEAPELLAAGDRAVNAYAAGVIKNIGEVNSGRLTDFQVDARMLEAVNRRPDPEL